MSDIDILQNKVADFGRKRGWAKYHSPKNISMALTVEAGELLEHFQWLSEGTSQQLDDEKIKEISYEVADVFMYTLLLCEQLGIDLKAATEKKLALNEQRFP